MLPFLNSSPPSPALSPAPRPSHSHHSRARSAPALTLDLSSITSSFRSPNHAYASNTLLLTGLDNLRLFQPATLDAIKAFLQDLAPLNSFSPLPSFRRIVVSFKEVGDAVKVRTYLEIKGLRTTRNDGNGTSSSNSNTVAASPTNSTMVREADAVFPRVYFGETTPLIEEGELAGKKNHLELPPAAKLFFISPPPSPPAGWQIKNEDPPNKEVIASDLEVALRKLGGTPPEQQPQFHGEGYPNGDDYELTYTPASITPTSPTFDDAGTGNSKSSSMSMSTTKCSQHFRNRSMSATIIYNPEDHGSSATDLPAVMVEDTTAAEPPAIEVQGETQTSPVEKEPGVPEMKNVKTSRPPVELM